MPDIWADYIESLNRCCDAIKLTAYHTKKTAEHTEIAANYTALTAFYIREHIKTRQELPERI